MNKRFIAILCILPIAAVILWILAGKNSGNFATLAIFLTCPLLHILFMNHHRDHTKHTQQN